MPKAAEPWSLTSLREKLIKIGAKVVSHGRYGHLPNGRGRRVATDVSGYPDAYRPAADAADASMRSFGLERRRPGWERRVLMRANDEVPAPQDRVAMAFSVQGGRSRANLVATEARRGPKWRHNLGNPGNVG